MKATLVIFVLLGFSFKTFSQSEAGFSLFAGFSNSSMAKSEWLFSHIRPPERSIQSPLVGLQFGYMFKENHFASFGIQPSMKGFRFKLGFVSPTTSQDASYEYRLYYLEFPLRYTYKHNRFTFSGGVIFSWLYDDDYIYKETGTFYVNGQKKTIRFDSAYPFNYDRFNRFDTGYLLGLGYELTKHFSLEIQFQKHLLRVDKWKSRDLTFNTTTIIGLRYRLSSN